MQAEQVINKILADARAEAEKIRKQAEEREAAEQAKLDEQLAKFEEQTKAMADKAAADERSQRLAVARMEAAREYLAGKAALLDDVFAQARQRLQQLPDNEYRELMVRLMLAAVDSGEEEVITGKGDARVDQKLVTEVNDKLKGRGRGNLKLSDEKENLGGGFILRHGRIRTNVSINVLVARARQDLEIELAKDLFANGADASRSR